MHEVDPIAPRGARDEAPHLIGLVMSIDEGPFDAGREQQIEPVLKQRTSVNGYKAFRNCVSDRPQTTADSGCQEESTHDGRDRQSQLVIRVIDLGDNVSGIEWDVADAGYLTGRSESPEIDTLPRVTYAKGK